LQEAWAMKIWVPLNLNKDHEVESLFSLITTEGNVLFLFSNALKRDDFLTTAALGNANPGGKIGHFELEAASFSDAAHQILGMDPSMAGNVIFLSDSDPLFDDYLKQMKQMAGISRTENSAMSGGE
jgi:hypothetical protein